MNIIKQIFYLLYEIIIVYYIYNIAVFLLKMGFIDISRDIYFVFLGGFLLIPLLKTFKLGRGSKIIELQNEVKINKSIKKLKSINRLDNPVLKSKNQKEKLDFLIITEKGIFNIVKCNMKGNIKIANDKEWYKKSKREYHLIESPVNKIKKFRKILRRAFDEDIIYDVIVMMEDRVDIKGEENSKVQIIRYSDLGTFIENFDAPLAYSSDEIYDMLYPYIYENKDNSKDLSLYEKYIESKWKYRGRLSIVLISFILYLKNIAKIL